MTTRIPQRIEYKNQYILTTAQLAELYGTDNKVISKNFTRNKKWYREWKDYFKLEGEEKLEFLKNRQIDDSFRTTKVFYLWTEQGALLHCRSLQTQEADEIFNLLRDSYFRVVQEQREQQKKHPLLLAAPNEIFFRRQKKNKWLGEVKRFTIHEKVNLLALSGILEELDFADNSFLENSLAAFFKPWCEEQGYDVNTVRFSKKPYIVVYEVKKDGSYDWERPIYRQVDSYPVTPFEMAWSIFLVDFYWPKKFLPYIKRKYKGEERAKNIKAAIRVIGFFTGLSEEEIVARQGNRSKKG